MLQRGTFATVGLCFSLMGCASVVIGVDGNSADAVTDAETAVVLDHADGGLADADVGRDSATLVDRPLSDVVPSDANTLIPITREARIDVIHAPRFSVNPDEIAAAILVPMRIDGTGRTVSRSGDCVVENLVAPATERLAEHFYFRTLNQEIEVTRTNILGWLAWEDFSRPFIGVGEVALRATGAGFPVPWAFAAQMPVPFSRLTAPSGVDQILLARTGEIPVSWDPSPGVTQVQIAFTTQHFIAATRMVNTSTIRCLLSPAVGSFALVPSNHPNWVLADRTDGANIYIDSIVQHRVPFGDIVAEVNLIYRQATFSVTFVGR